MADTAKKLKRPDNFDGEAHGALLHPGDAQGSVTIARKGLIRRWSETRVDLPDLPYILGQMRGQPHVYLSQQRFDGWRRISRLKELGSCYLDLDFRNTVRYAEVESEHVADAVLMRLDDLGLPDPWLLHTGRGLLALWPFDPQPRHILPRWRAMQRHLKEALHGFGVDAGAMDAARVFRVCGTLNLSAVPEDREVKLLHVASTTRWDFEDLAREVLPETRPGELDAEIVSLNAKRAGKRAHNGGFTPAKRLTWSTMWESRLTDLQKVRHGRWWGEIPTGWRDYWMLLAGTAMSWLSPAGVLQRELHALANEAGRWDLDETKTRLSAVIHRAQMADRGETVEFNGQLWDPRYHYRTDTILELLEIDESEQRRLGLRALVSRNVRKEIEAADRRAQRREAGVQDRATYEAAAEARRRRIRELSASGMTQKAIASELHVSERTVRNALKRPDEPTFQNPQKTAKSA